MVLRFHVSALDALVPVVGYRVPRWYLSLVAVAWDAAGFHVAIFLKNPDGEVYAYAIGVHEGVVGLADLPGITMDQFAPA
jgi:hypothetical protein